MKRGREDLVRMKTLSTEYSVRGFAFNCRRAGSFTAGVSKFAW